MFSHNDSDQSEVPVTIGVEEIAVHPLPPPEIVKLDNPP